MAIKFSRREFVGRAGAAAMVSLAAQAVPDRVATAAERPTRFDGIFAILQTPFTSSGLMDDEDLAHEAEFCVRCIDECNPQFAANVADTWTIGEICESADGSLSLLSLP